MSTPSAPGAHPQSREHHDPEYTGASAALPPEDGGIRLPGVEEPLPPGERVLWRGRPALWPTAFRVLHLRAILFYWALIAAGFLLWGMGGGPTAGSLAADLTWLVVVALLGTGVILALAWLIRVTTLYVLTERRIVMRVGIALPGVLNLPHERIGKVDLRRNRDGSGDLVLTPAGDERIGWLFLWPHVRPWRWKDPLPAFRAISSVDEVGTQVASAVTRRIESSEPSEGAARAIPDASGGQARKAVS